MIEVETEVDNWRKKTTSDRVLKQATLGLLASKYEKCTKIFTDASKIEDRCGIGVYDQTNNFMLKLKLQNTVCIMSAELEAIYVALQYLEKRQIYNAVILTDSKSGCELIRSQMDNNEQDEVIFSIIRKAAGMMTRIQWIPGHVNVQGNETADRLAKLGLDQTEAVVNKMFPHDAISRCKDAIMDEVQMWYVSYTQEQGKGRKFFQYQTGINSKSWYHNVPLTNSEVRTLNRLIAGHDFSPYWLSVMRIKDDRCCELCEKPNTAEHIILNCIKHLQLRDKHQLDAFFTILDVFETKDVNNLKRLINFLKELKLQI
ncbi:hypothetical protein RP20_CCG025874 [Aedes albopictus]|nr:hypothetical protein RP20_CCG008729 [Aedes albopictus]KXJ80262.1 hypothetical protein RP20_CCG025874 [Aedes albopictus]